MSEGGQFDVRDFTGTDSTVWYYATTILCYTSRIIESETDILVDIVAWFFQGAVHMIPVTVLAR